MAAKSGPAGRLVSHEAPISDWVPTAAICNCLARGSPTARSPERLGRCKARERTRQAASIAILFLSFSPISTPSPSSADQHVSIPDPARSFASGAGSGRTRHRVYVQADHGRSAQIRESRIRRPQPDLSRSYSLSRSKWRSQSSGLSATNSARRTRALNARFGKVSR